MPLGIRDFNGKNYFHIWVLKMIDIASLANGYQDYWIGCGWIDWIKFRFFKHFRHMKKLTKNYNKQKDIAFIDISVFIDEVCEACNVKSVNIESMFEGYWKI